MKEFVGNEASRETKRVTRECASERAREQQTARERETDEAADAAAARQRSRGRGRGGAGDDKDKKEEDLVPGGFRSHYLKCVRLALYQLSY